VAALAKQAAAVRARHGLRVQTAFGDEPQVPTEIKQALYRIAQEALQNTIKHARATSVQVELASGVEGISLHLSDDGIGFDPTQSFPGHVGLHSMQERAARLGGKLEVTSEPHRGTRVSVQIPVVREPVR
jgi:signal transduction histidine kinase